MWLIRPSGLLPQKSLVLSSYGVSMLTLTRSLMLSLFFFGCGGDSTGSVSLVSPFVGEYSGSSAACIHSGGTCQDGPSTSTILSIRETSTSPPDLMLDISGCPGMVFSVRQVGASQIDLTAGETFNSCDFFGAQVNVAVRRGSLNSSTRLGLALTGRATPPGSSTSQEFLWHFGGVRR